MDPSSPSLLTRLRARAPLSFHDFMEAALYDSEEGFYGSGRARVGREGDFITNISVGPLFGRLLARQMAEMWERAGRPARWTVAEQGAHDGTLLRDLQQGLAEDAPACAATVEWVLIEPGAVWRERQRKTLAGGAPVRWVSRPGELTGVEGIFFSNELLDAFPVHRVVRRGGRWYEQWVEGAGAGFRLTEGPEVAGAVAEAAASLPLPLPEGYVAEVCPAQRAWLRETAGALRRGFVWLIDYGFERAELYRPDRVDGTLSAYAAQERVKDLCARPGEIDLTAHVDLTALREEAEAAGLREAGYAGQQQLMAGLAPLHFADVAEVTPARAREQRALMTLLHPGLLGAAFQTLCWARGVEGELSGFRFARPR